MQSLTSAGPWERGKGLAGGWGRMQGWLSLVGGWTRRGCGMKWCSAGVLCLPSISPPGWGCLRLGKSLGKVAPSSRASRGCSELCRGKLWLQQESSAAGLRGFISEREKSRVCLTLTLPLCRKALIQAPVRLCCFVCWEERESCVPPCASS